MKKILLRADVHHGDRAIVAGILRHRENSEYASPVRAPASLRTVLSVLLAAELIGAVPPPAHAGRLEFDQRRTEVRFVYKMANSTQRGRFTKVSGTLDYDDAAPEKSRSALRSSRRASRPAKRSSTTNSRARRFLTSRSRPSSPSGASSSDRARQRRQMSRARSPSTASPSP